MELVLRFIVFTLVLILCGCETTKLWRGDPADEFIKIVPATSDENVETALKASGREYYCQDLYASTHPNNKVCYARLTAEDKIKNTQVKLLKTPEALALDAGHTIKVVGSVALNSIMLSGYHR
jgi:hypothetical protein